jgi:site-specific recombinase XerC
MSGLPLFDAAGRRRSPATMPGYHAGREPRNKGRTYPADPPTVEEIVAVMRQAGEDRHGLRARALIVVLWRAALRIQEALSLTETDLDPNRCSVLVQRGKGGHRREVEVDMWAWGALRPWLTERKQLPVGPLFCVIDGPTRGPPRLVGRRRARRVPTALGRRWRPAPVRATSAPPRARR